MNSPEVNAYFLRVSESLSVCAGRFSVWAVIEGHATMKSEWETNEVGPMDIFTTLPNETVSFVPDPQMVVLRVELDETLITDAFGGDFVAIYCSSRLGMDSTPLYEVMLRLADLCYCEGNPGWQIQVKSHAYRLLYLLSRLPINQINSVSESAEVGRPHQIAQYLSLHCCDTIAESEVAAQFHLSPQYFSKYFRETFGVTFSAYLRGLRLDSAAKTLLKGNQSITAVAFASGFPNLAAFNKSFSQRFGMSPQAFCQSHAREKEANADHAVLELDETAARELLSSLDITPDHAPLTRQALCSEVSVLSSRPIYDSWREIINLGPADLCLNALFQEQFTTCNQTGIFRYARVLNPFSADIFPEGCTSGHTSFRTFDRMIDFLDTAGCKPILELGPRPTQIIRSARFFENVNASVPASPEERANFLRELLWHSIELRGVEEVSTWRFESWCPQSAGTVLLDHVPETYPDYFVHEFTAIKSVCPRTEVGGLGFNINLQSTDIAHRLLLSLRSRGIHMDFISLYAYPGYITDYDSTSMTIHAMLPTSSSDMKDRLQFWYNMIYSVFPDVKIYLTEFSSDISCRFLMNESANKAAAIAEFCIDNFDSVNGMGYWFFSDLAYEDVGSLQPLFGGNGLVSRDGLKKPSYYAMYFLSRMGKQLIAKGKNYMLTTSPDGRYQLLVHNHKDLSAEYCSQYFTDETAVSPDRYFEDNASLQFDLTLTDLPEGTYLIKKYSINDRNGLLAGMEELHDTRILRKEELDWLQSTCIPSQCLDYQTTESGKITISATLEPNEVDYYYIFTTMSLDRH